ncbi:MAG: hypothetical protein DRO15_01210 [Thermoprotei archaeon]|nr:MAG: hypothetical protein DRO15_01210 [Thermoprotei archaeon]
MPWPIEIKGDKLVVWERQGGTRGTKYFYILDPHRKRLIHVSQLFTSVLEGTSRAGRRRDYRHEVSLTVLRKELGPEITLFMFWYTNKGYGPSTTKYIINCSRKTIEEERVDIANVSVYEFEVLGPEREWIELYEKYVHKMMDTVRNIVNKLGIDVLFAGRARRLEDLYTNSKLGLINALIQPSWQSRQKALETYVRSTHELYVLFLAADSLDAKTIYHISSDGKPYWWIEYASDFSTAVVETSTDRKYTFWFQFSPKKWWDVVREGWIYAMFGRPIGQLPPSRQYVRPDIVIMRGEYQHRSDLKRATPALVVLIDAKISFDEADFKQLEGYAKNFGKLFGEKVIYIVACLDRIPPRYKRMLERIGYHIIEEVVPGEKGEKRFQDFIRKVLWE